MASSRVHHPPSWAGGVTIGGLRPEGAWREGALTRARAEARRATETGQIGMPSRRKQRQEPRASDQNAGGSEGELGSGRHYNRAAPDQVTGSVELGDSRTGGNTSRCA